MPDRASMSPDVLARYRRLVASVTYKPGWVLKVAGPLGRVLCVYALTPDSLRPSQTRTTQHQFPLPDEDMPDREFLRWMFDRLLLAELHEAAEFYAVDGFRPHWPHHQDEGSPYELVTRWESEP